MGAMTRSAEHTATNVVAWFSQRITAKQFRVAAGVRAYTNQ